jgi:hypothetical protein
MHVVTMTHRIDIVGPVPCSAHPKHLAGMGNLAAHVQAAHCRPMTADEVDPAVGDQRQPLVLVDKQLTHSKRRGGFLAEELEPTDIVGGHRIFHVEGHGSTALHSWMAWLGAGRSWIPT